MIKTDAMMKKTTQIRHVFSTALFFVLLPALLMPDNVWGDAGIWFASELDKKCILVGGLESQYILISAQVEPKDAIAEWRIDGPGTLSTDDVQLDTFDVWYIPPIQIEQPAEKVTITLIVTTTDEKIESSINLALISLSTRGELNRLHQKRNLQEEIAIDRKTTLLNQLQNEFSQSIYRYRQLKQLLRRNDTTYGDSFSIQAKSRNNSNFSTMLNDELASILAEIVINWSAYEESYQKIFQESSEVLTAVSQDFRSVRRLYEEELFDRLFPTNNQATSADIYHCENRSYDLNTILDSFQGLLVKYKVLKDRDREQAGAYTDNELLVVLEAIVCDLLAVEKILEENFAITQDAATAERTERTRATREKYEIELRERLLKSKQ